MVAKIYQPARNAMQSGQGNSQDWVLEFEQAEARKVDPLMGWTSSGDMNSQVKLRFDTKDEAIAYATQNGLAYLVQEPKKRDHNVRAGGYAENFSSKRRAVWTH